jgi:hypothetical protein
VIIIIEQVTYSVNLFTIDHLFWKFFDELQHHLNLHGLIRFFESEGQPLFHHCSFSQDSPSPASDHLPIHFTYHLMTQNTEEEDESDAIFAEFFESIKVDRKFTVILSSALSVSNVNISENGAGGNFYNLFVSLL